MDTALGTVAIAPEILDGALAVVVDVGKQTLAVWKGRSHIDLYAMAGSWHDVVALGGNEVHGTWARDEVLAQAAAAIDSLVPQPPSPPPETHQIRVDIHELHRAWLVRARGNGYALWDGGGVVDVYGPDGTRLRQLAVRGGDLTSMSKQMLGLLAGNADREDPSALP